MKLKYAAAIYFIYVYRKNVIKASHTTTTARSASQSIRFRNPRPKNNTGTHVSSVSETVVQNSKERSKASVRSDSPITASNEANGIITDGDKHSKNFHKTRILENGNLVPIGTATKACVSQINSNTDVNGSQTVNSSVVNVLKRKNDKGPEGECKTDQMKTIVENQTQDFLNHKELLKRFILSKIPKYEKSANGKEKPSKQAAGTMGVVKNNLKDREGSEKELAQGQSHSQINQESSIFGTVTSRYCVKRDHAFVFFVTKKSIDQDYFLEITIATTKFYGKAANVKVLLNQSDRVKYICVSDRVYKVMQKRNSIIDAKNTISVQNNPSSNLCRDQAQLLVIHRCNGLNNIPCDKKYFIELHTQNSSILTTKTPQNIYNEFSNIAFESYFEYKKKLFDFINANDVENSENQSLHIPEIKKLRFLYHKIPELTKKFREEIRFKAFKNSDNTKALVHTLENNFSFKLKEIREYTNEDFSNVKSIDTEKHQSNNVNTKGIDSADKTIDKFAQLKDFKNRLDAIIFGKSFFSIKNEDKLFFAMPDLLFYIDWRLQINYRAEVTMLTENEHKLIQDVLNYYEINEVINPNIDIKSTILRLRSIIQNHLEPLGKLVEYSEPLYSLAMDSGFFISTDSTDDCVMMEFIAFLLPFTLESEIVNDYIKEIKSKFDYKRYSTFSYKYNFFEKVTEFADPCFEIVLALNLVLDFLKSKKTCKENMDTLILYPLKTRNLLFTKCGLCGRIIISCTNPRDMIKAFYKEICKIMASN